jgi:hypothetical protein
VSPGALTPGDDKPSFGSSILNYITQLRLMIERNNPRNDPVKPLVIVPEFSRQFSARECLDHCVILGDSVQPGSGIGSVHKIRRIRGLAGEDKNPCATIGPVKNLRRWPAWSKIPRTDFLRRWNSSSRMAPIFPDPVPEFSGLFVGKKSITSHITTFKDDGTSY